MPLQTWVMRSLVESSNTRACPLALGSNELPWGAAHPASGQRRLPPAGMRALESTSSAPKSLRAARFSLQWPSVGSAASNSHIVSRGSRPLPVPAPAPVPGQGRTETHGRTYTATRSWHARTHITCPHSLVATSTWPAHPCAPRAARRSASVRGRCGDEDGGRAAATAAAMRGGRGWRR